jgi:hypothetical protein
MRQRDVGNGRIEHLHQHGKHQRHCQQNTLSRVDNYGFGH